MFDGMESYRATLNRDDDRVKNIEAWNNNGVTLYFLEKGKFMGPSDKKL